MVSLLFHNNPKAYGIDVYVAGSGSSRTLFIPAGDPDGGYQYVFEKRP
jgi:hypothetical protein